MIKLEIEGIEDFKEFIRIIRNRDTDYEKIIEETKQLNEGSQKLKNVLESQKGE